VNLHNAFATAVNALIDWVRSIDIDPGKGKVQPFASFGTKMEMLDHMEREFDDLADALADNTDATDGNTKATYEQTTQNLPSGYKVGGGIYDAISTAPHQRTLESATATTGGSGTTVNINRVYVMSKRKQFIEEISDEIQKSYGMPFGGGPGPPDDHN
jgi:hypothetical protein